MAKKTSGLGRGFEALLPINFDNSIITADGDKIQKLSVTIIVPNPHQPRREFDDQALSELASSLKQYGVLQPLVVSPAVDGIYELIAGERRLRAARLAGISEVPVIIRSSKDQERLELALIENVQRVDLSPLDQAVSIEGLHQQFNLPYDAIARRLGKAMSTVNNTVRLLNLPKDAMEALRHHDISEGHARAILSIKDFPGQQTELLKNIVENGWSVRQAERYATGVKSGHSTVKSAKQRVDTETPATRHLSQKLKAPVQVKRMAKGGRLEIKFKDDQDLDRIVEKLGL